LSDNQLVIRKLELSFVPDKYADSFERDIIDIYMSSSERATFGLPIITDDIMFSIPPVYKAAGIMSEESGNTEKFSELLEETDDDEIDLALDILGQYEASEYYNIGYEEMYYEDVYEVIQHHSLCFADIDHNPFSSKTFYIVTNPPIVTVW
jgi:hypothetical protein